MAVICGSFGVKVNVGLTILPLASIEDAMAMAMIGPLASAGGLGSCVWKGGDAAVLKRVVATASESTLRINKVFLGNVGSHLLLSQNPQLLPRKEFPVYAQFGMQLPSTPCW